MESAIQEFISYLKTEKNASLNTIASYERDLKKMHRYLTGMQGLSDWKSVTLTHLNAYMLYLEDESYAASSISRCVASVRTFYQFLISKGIVSKNPAEALKPPKAEKKAPSILTVEQVSKLLSMPNLNTVKGMRDSAMLELIYATGIRVSELISLRVSNLNLKMDYVICSDGSKERAIPFGSAAKAALERYMNGPRAVLVTGDDEGWLFTNVQGRQMSRQGFWKLLKNYASECGIESEITPHTLRHSFAVHMIAGGADLRSIQEMMGHSDISSTQMYLNLSIDRMKNVYDSSHPRK